MCERSNQLAVCCRLYCRCLLPSTRCFLFSFLLFLITLLSFIIITKCNNSNRIIFFSCISWHIHLNYFINTAVYNTVLENKIFETRKQKANSINFSMKLFLPDKSNECKFLNVEPFRFMVVVESSPPKER